MLQGLGFFANQTNHRPDDDTGNQVTQYRTQPEALRQRHRDDRGAEVNKGLNKIAGHDVTGLAALTH